MVSLHPDTPSPLDPSHLGTTGSRSVVTKKSKVSDARVKAGLGESTPIAAPPEIHIPMTPKPTHGDIAFFELMRRSFSSDIPGKQPALDKTATLQKVMQYHGREEDVKTLVKALGEGNLRHPLFDDLDDMAWLSLWAVKEGLMNESQFATLMNVKTAIETEGRDYLMFVPLFIDDEINPQAQDLFEEMCKAGGKISSRTGEVSAHEPFFTGDQIKQFFEKAKSLDPANRFILTTQDMRPVEEADDVSQDDLCQHFTRSLGINFMNRSADAQARVIPSIGLMQAALDTKNPDTAVEVHPVVGHSTYDDLARGALFNWRDLSIAFPGVPLSSVADGFPTPGTDFTYHDFYHAILASNMPVGQKQIYIWFAYIIKSAEYKDLDSAKQKDVQKIAERLGKIMIDMEVGILRKGARTLLYPGLSDDAMFWVAMSQAIARVPEQVRKKDDKDPNYARFSTRDAEIDEALGIVLSKLFTTLKEANKEGLEWQTHGVTLEGLKEAFTKEVALAEQSVSKKNFERIDKGLGKPGQISPSAEDKLPSFSKTLPMDVKPKQKSASLPIQMLYEIYTQTR